MINYVREILKKLPAKTALDVATGMGYMAHEIATHCPLIEKVYAIDLNSKAIEKASQINKDIKIEFRVMDAEELQFAGNSLDLVTVQASLHHFRNPVTCISEMLRVLKPNYPLLVYEQISEADTPEQKIMHDWHKIGIKIDQREGIPHYDMFSESELRAFFSQFDFINLAIERQSDTQIIKDEQIIQSMISVLDSYYKRIINERDRIELSEEIEDVKKRLRKYGFAYPPSLVILGMK